MDERRFVQDLAQFLARGMPASPVEELLEEYKLDDRFINSPPVV